MGGATQYNKLASLIGGVVQLDRLLHMRSQYSAVRLAVRVCCSALHIYLAVRARLAEYFLTPPVVNTPASSEQSENYRRHNSMITLLCCVRLLCLFCMLPR